MSDIRFNNWKHQSGTGGVYQDSLGQVGIGSTIPSATLDVGGNAVFTGIVTANSFSGSWTGSTGSFSGNVTIDGDLGVGGTVTYEDVARVDATGISTFREGFKVGPLAGIAATYYTDGSVRIQANASGALVTGVITATTGSFTGNISVGGTLTYEDVTNVDSVGLITARNGIKVTGGDVQVGSAVTVDTSGINVTGVVTATSYRGDGSSLTGIEAAPTVQGTVSGNIAANSATIVKADGNLAACDALAVGGGAVQEFSDTINASANDQVNICSVGTDKILVAYNKGANGTYVRCGTIGGASKETVTWGTELQIYNATSNWLQIGWDTGTSRWVCLYNHGDDNKPYSTVGELSGTTLTKGNEQDWGADGTVSENLFRYCSNPGWWVWFFRLTSDNDNGSLKRVVVNTNNTLTMGGIQNNWQSGATYPQDMTDVSPHGGQQQQHLCLVYRWSGVVVTRSCETYSGGSFATNQAMNISTGNDQNARTAYGKWTDSNGIAQSIIVGIYKDVSDGNKLIMKGGNIVGGGNPYYDWQSAHILDTGSTDSYSLTFNPATELFVVTYTVGGDIKMKTVSVLSTGSGGQNAWDCVVKSTATVLSGSVGDNFWAASDGTNKRVALSYRGTTGSDGDVQVLRTSASSTLTTSNMIGFTGADSYTNGQTATVKVVGNVSTQSGLTPGEKYYVQDNGSLATTAGSISVVAGRALSATQLLIQPAYLYQ